MPRNPQAFDIIPSRLGRYSVTTFRGGNIACPGWRSKHIALRSRTSTCCAGLTAEVKDPFNCLAVPRRSGTTIRPGIHAALHGVRNEGTTMLDAEKLRRHILEDMDLQHDLILRYAAGDTSVKQARD